MKNLFLITVLILGGAVLAQAQQRGRPDPTPQTTSERRTQQSIDRAKDISNRSNSLQLLEKLPPQVRGNNKFFKESIRPFYRKTTKEERSLLAPNEEDFTKHRGFLSQKKAGILRLIIDKGCVVNPKVVSAKPHCAKFSMPGAGSAYSFRYYDYRLVHLADLNFRKNTFQALGTLTHGIMVNLGNVSLEDINVKTKGMNFLAKFKPAKDLPKAADIANKLVKGINKDGFKYASVLPVKENMTYALRSVAYKGESLKKVGKIVFNEFELDKRKDIIIAFRVVRFHPNEDVTILWKEIQSRKAPKMKMK